MHFYIFAMAATAIPVATAAMLPPENSIIPFSLLTGGFMLMPS